MKALDLAIEFSLRDGSKLSLVNIVVPPMVGMPSQILEEMKKAGESALEQAKIRCNEAGLSATTILKVTEDDSSAAYEISQIAVEGHFDCVILGSRGYAGRLGILMGSMGISLAISLPCTTIIVR
jgi:nucleotide-binding universal stress UspA family protein